MSLMAEPDQAAGNASGRAMGLLEKIVERRQGTWAEHRARFKLGRWLRHDDNPATRRRGDRLLETLARSDRHTAYTHEARLVLALDAIDGDAFAKARDLLKRIPAEDVLWHRQARLYLRAMEDPDSRIWTLLNKPHPARRPSAER
ncbi:MAG: hypothetical protein R3236_04925 [Phycisphaeraceae bacterium]|nr:hypothetical protein [Phycisphaeraceae bacterium]